MFACSLACLSRRSVSEDGTRRNVMKPDRGEASGGDGSGDKSRFSDYRRVLLKIPQKSHQVSPKYHLKDFRYTSTAPFGLRKIFKHLPEIILPCMIKRYWQVPLRRVLSCGTQRMLLEKSRLRCKLDSLHQTKGF